MKLTKEIRIALVAIVGILVMYFGINFLKGINLFSTSNTYYLCRWLQGGYRGAAGFRLFRKGAHQGQGGYQQGSENPCG